jgi:hypothetical protein
MLSIEGEFYRSTRGPAPSDEDVRQLILDRVTGSLLVRHAWVR